MIKHKYAMIPMEIVTAKQCTALHYIAMVEEPISTIAGVLGGSTQLVPL